MMSSKFAKWTLKVGVTCIVVMLALTGCSQSPVGVEAEKSQPVLLQRAPVYSGGASFSPLNEFRIAESISAEEGGTLVLCDVILEVPPGAVRTDTTFSIYIPDINVFYNEFGTDGLVFDVPVTVTMSYREADLSGVSEESIRIAFYNDNAGVFEDVDCDIDFENKTVTAKLNHFSAYGLISDEF